MIQNAKAKSIELSNVGPIEHLTIPIPDGGGVVVIRGRNGSGKSHALESCEALYSASSRKGLRPSDGMPSGKIDGLGVTVRLGRSNTVKGELLCESLDGRVDPSMLVDPGLKDPMAADSRRLATLIRLSGVKVTGQQWADQLGLAESPIDLDGLIDEDPVATADRIRRRLHDAALTREKLATSESTEAAALARSIADVDLTADADPDRLSQAVSRTAEALAAARAQRDQAIAAKERMESTLRELAEARKANFSTDLPENSVQRSEELLKEAAIELKEAGEAVEAAARALVEARHAKELVQDKYQAAMERLENNRKWLAERAEHSQRIQQLESRTREAVPDAPTDEAIAALVAQKEQALLIAKQGEVVRRALELKRKADRLAAAADDKSAEAEQLRTKARSTDQVLEQALIDAGFTAIKVHDGRLCVQSDRGLEPFSELSHGERWTVALELASKGLPAGSVLPVCQEAWESLDPDNRQRVCSMAKSLGLVLVTAEADAGELRAEVEVG
jgi:DNA repair exonuclease SbcCD ATPase subunit